MADLIVIATLGVIWMLWGLMLAGSVVDHGETGWRGAAITLVLCALWPVVVIGLLTLMLLEKMGRL